MSMAIESHAPLRNRCPVEARGEPNETTLRLGSSGADHALPTLASGAIRPSNAVTTDAGKA